MRKIHLCLLLLFVFYVTHPEYVVKSEIEKSYVVEENIKNIKDYIQKQDYYQSISKLCHEEECFSIDLQNLTRSLEKMEEKILQKIEEKFGEEKSLEARLKGISITKILTR